MYAPSLVLTPNPFSFLSFQKISFLSFIYMTFTFAKPFKIYMNFIHRMLICVVFKAGNGSLVNRATFPRLAHRYRWFFPFAVFQLTLS